MSKDMATNSEVVHSVEDEAYEPQTYNDAFPALEAARDVSNVQQQGAWQSQTGAWKHPTVRSIKCTQVFSVPLEERRFKEMDDRLFGDETEQTKICKDIMSKTGVSIEISMAKDQSLTVVVHGKGDAVMRARREVMTRLQTQANTIVSIPKEHHRYILGKSGKKLQELELSTATKINIPRPDENSDSIKIVGPKEGIDKAKHEIQLISAEQAKLGFERLPILKVFHPFVCGPNNQIIKTLMEETNAKINVPPPSVMKDEIVVSGEKDGVMKCKDTLMKIYEEKKKKCQTVSVEVRKSQHKYIIGPRAAGLHEILGATGVSVEVPPSDSTSETITLRGEQEKLGPALTMVYSKANSVVFSDVVAPAWLHRYVIGRKGANIKKISEDYSKVHIEFVENQDKITIEGPPEEVDEAVKALQKYVDDLKSRMTFAEITVDQKFHKHIIGKSGSNITKIKNSTGVSIQIPSDDEKSNIIRIEGNPEGVEEAKKQLHEMSTRMENEKSRDITIEQRFHKTIIGAKGENIKEIRDKFNQVQITFPEAGKKSAVVTLRGPKNDVDRSYKYLQHYHTELLESNYQAEVHIFKGFHKNIIGKGGANIRKIRDETDTKIDLPSENSDSDVILITGKRENVENAKSQIEVIQKELANIKEVTVEIPSNLHNSIIGAKGRLIRAIMEECGGVIIRFPPEGTSSDKVMIRGPKDDVENAKKQLMEMASEKKLSGFTAEVQAKAQYHKFLIGRGGANIRKVRESTGARIIFPTNNDKDQETISIIGTKESVEMAQKELEGLIKNLVRLHGSSAG
ncbi:vigilin [Patella vulgata]|uniref:vigilin n=1 Tax=Patella vulgata TaxID=6465 RepID=UPI0024A90814|nr:vigilin [Patella vulgata]